MLNSRLQTILDMLPEVDSLLDVGTDHCLLPIAIKQTYPHMEVAASDVANGPLQSAKRQLMQYQVSDIQLYLSNGLQSIDKQYDCVVIAGMGANTMVDILGNDIEYAKNCKYLVLQANKDVDILRKWLHENGFCIVDEQIVFDYKYYQILVVTVGYQKLDNLDIVFGPILRRKHSYTFVDYWKQELEKYQSIVSMLPQGHVQLEKANQMIQWINEMI